MLSAGLIGAAVLVTALLLSKADEPAVALSGPTVFDHPVPPRREPQDLAGRAARALGLYSPGMEVKIGARVRGALSEFRSWEASDISDSTLGALAYQMAKTAHRYDKAISQASGVYAKPKDPVKARAKKRAEELARLQVMLNERQRVRADMRRFASSHGIELYGNQVKAFEELPFGATLLYR